MLHNDEEVQDKVLIICGAAHIAFNYGVPDEIFRRTNLDVRNRLYTIMAYEDDSVMASTNEYQIKGYLERKFGDLNPADTCFFLNKPATE